MIELKNDKLNRKPFLDSLFALFNNFGNQGNKGLTILINGKYGSGKTTTLGFIKEKNISLKNFSVIEYNAWENNLFDNPLIPVLNEINQNDGNLNFIRSLMKFECVGGFTDSVKLLITKMFDLFGFSVRECQHLVSEINLICNEVDYTGELRPVYYWYPPLVALILITKYKYNAVYNKWFYKEKSDYYRSNKISFKDSNYYKFIEDIKDTKLHLIEEYLINPDDGSGIPQSFLLNLINALTPFKLIEENELAAYTRLELSDIKTFRPEATYPYVLNNVISKVKMLNFR